jgi:hypothetical protein
MQVSMALSIRNDSYLLLSFLLQAVHATHFAKASGIARPNGTFQFPALSEFVQLLALDGSCIVFRPFEIQAIQRKQRI